MIFKGPLGHAPVSEADIQAYTDGSAAGERAIQVQRYLAAHPAEWGRVQFYRRLNDQIRRSFPDDGDAATAAPGLPARGLLAPGSGSRRGLRRWWAALALVAVLIGVVWGGPAITEPTQQVLNDAAVMALLEVTNRADAPGANAVAQVSTPFDLKAAGLRLVSADTRELGPFAHSSRYIYENDEGQKVVLLGTRAWFAPAAPQWSAHRLGSMRLIYWTAHGTRWVLAGDAQTHGLMRAADVATR
jgi:hypothetical protein